MKEKIQRFVEDLNESQLKFLDSIIKDNLGKINKLYIKKSDNNPHIGMSTPAGAEFYKREIGQY